MKLAMTIMVRDEADIIAAMLDHHEAQGVDTFIVTDNGSVDGTTEILERYAAEGRIDLRHDPVHRKQQAPVVTQMARDAYTRYGADWVINADADEFFLPVDRTKTLHEVFEQIPKTYLSFLVPVVNLTGAPAKDGTGFDRLVYRDARTQDQLELAGVRAHPTPDAVHIGSPDIDVIQGNHFVSLASQGSPPPELAIEVLHLPWRSWKQYKNKVEISGRAYESNPELTPSPNHHGMRDYARLKAGALLPYYFMRHPTPEELEQGAVDGTLVRDDVLADALTAPVPDADFDKATRKAQLAFSEALRYDRVQRAKRIASGFEDRLEAAAEREADLAARLAVVEGEAAALRSRRVVRATDRLARLVRRR
ncbi:MULTISPECIES: glycosyltransferase family 2 protein [unclassified Plantibacter]|uniref:glycosyltransferase family 2 protein n=1 Tax=Plantibacter TaxID=190323 RepID=UPI0012F08237|nr:MULTISPECIES: glycosyltransferase family 2 protein [unclassified Plantibacter]VXC42410.1 Glycosyl transferase family 2 [Plantibacter sp. T3]